jgi:zinc transporter, ZIP family
MGAALGWGSLAASSLLIGAWLGALRPWRQAPLGVVLAFGAGALISAVSFELAAEGVAVGGAGSVAIGLAAGALTYYLLDGALERGGAGGRHMERSGTGSDPGPALALGAFLDGIPEQLALGIGLAYGGTVSVALLVAIYVSNLPEAIGSSSELRRAGRNRETILRLWLAVAVICTLATVVGFAVADSVSGELRAGVNGFAAGGLLVMLVDSMIPEAEKKTGRAAGLVTTLGFAVAAGLSTVS